MSQYSSVAACFDELPQVVDCVDEPVDRGEVFRYAGYPQGHADDPVENGLQGGMLVVGVLDVEGEERDLVTLRKPLQKLEAADLPAHVEGNEPTRFHPEQLHPYQQMP